MKHPAVRLSIMVLITVGALYLAFRNVDLDSLLAEFRQTNLLLIVAGVLLLFCSHAMRAWRWKIIMRPLKAKTNMWVGFKAIMAAYAMNNVIPRSGELVRPYIVAKHEKIFMSGTIASILVERVADLVSNLLFIMLAFIVFPREIAHGFPSVAEAMVPVMIAMCALLILLMIMIFSAGKTVRMIYRITARLPEKLRTSIDRAAAEFANGLRGVRASGALPVVLGTLGIWVFYVLSMFAWLYAFPEHSITSVGLIGAFFLRVVSGVAFLIPSPGGTGSYHYFISQALFRIFSVPLPAAIAYATLTHAAMYILTTVTGLVFLATEGISLKNFGKLAKASEDHSPRELEEALKGAHVKVGALGIEE
jgi:uncharacterized protein (TIRG00374 family)